VIMKRTQATHDSGSADHNTTSGPSVMITDAGG